MKIISENHILKINFDAMWSLKKVISFDTLWSLKKVINFDALWSLKKVISFDTLWSLKKVINFDALWSLKKVIVHIWTIHINIWEDWTYVYRKMKSLVKKKRKHSNTNGLGALKHVFSTDMHCTLQNHNAAGSMLKAWRKLHGFLFVLMKPSEKE